jgi:hypothetical protein
VPPGELELALDDAHLPAQFASDGVRQQLHLTGSRRLQLDLHAIPLNAVRGHVYVDLNGNGAFDPGEGVPNVVVRLGPDGPATMTDEDGAYGFHNLLPNRYRVRLDTERLSREFVVASDDTLEIELGADGRPLTGVDFRVAPKQRPVVLQKRFPQ